MCVFSNDHCGDEGLFRASLQVLSQLSRMMTRGTSFPDTSGTHNTSNTLFVATVIKMESMSERKYPVLPCIRN